MGCFVLGPILELRLPLGLAVEADALYRPMEFKVQQTNARLASFLLGTATGLALVNRVNVWEFPILAKYRLPVPFFKPYLEAGPSFRATGASLAKQMSGRGVSAGIGVETRLGPLLLAPEMRYTHWGADGAYSSPYHVTSYPNQVEFLMGVATSLAASGVGSFPAAGPRKLLMLGVKGGMAVYDCVPFGLVRTGDDSSVQLWRFHSGNQRVPATFCNCRDAPGLT